MVKPVSTLRIENQTQPCLVRPVRLVRFFLAGLVGVYVPGCLWVPLVPNDVGARSRRRLAAMNRNSRTEFLRTQAKQRWVVLSTRWNRKGLFIGCFVPPGKEVGGEFPPTGLMLDIWPRPSYSTVAYNPPGGVIVYAKRRAVSGDRSVLDIEAVSIVDWRVSRILTDVGTAVFSQWRDEKGPLLFLTRRPDALDAATLYSWRPEMPSPSRMAEVDLSALNPDFPDRDTILCIIEHRSTA